MRAKLAAVDATLQANMDGLLTFTWMPSEDKGAPGLSYSPVSNIGDIWSLEERADESSIVLNIDKVGLDAVLQQFV